VTYTVTALIDPAATGSFVNTATVTAGAGVVDTNPANNSATDTDTLTAQADLAITKSDGVSEVNDNSTTTYTIVVSNAGPSGVTGATVSDPVPFRVGFSYSAIGSGGASGFTASGTGAINDSVDLPAGATITYTLVASTGTGSSGASPTSPLWRHPRASSTRTPPTTAPPTRTSCLRTWRCPRPS
jgi:uncharacterized repeat protein (TIGR01451 family)